MIILPHGFQQPPSTSRWFLQIRTLRLAVPQTEGSSTSNSTRTMYMARYAAHPDTVTLIIEDPARAAVNVSTVGSGTFDHFLSSNLLPSQQHSRQEGSASYQPGRWIPRPSYCQVEGAVIEDAEADFRISVGMISTRGGASGTSSSASETLLIQVGFLHLRLVECITDKCDIARILGVAISASGLRSYTGRIPLTCPSQVQLNSQSVSFNNNNRLEKLTRVVSA